MKGTEVSKTAISEMKQLKAGEDLKNLRLKAVNDLIQSLNHRMIESIERLLREEYDDDVVVNVNHFSKDTYHGRNALLLIWLAIHEVYPDGMFKFLDKRCVTRIKPNEKNSVTSNACPDVEFVYKFKGSEITPGALGTVIHNFANTYKNYSTYGSKKLYEKLVQFLASNYMAIKLGSQILIGEATLRFLPNSAKVKEITFNLLVYDISR